MRSHGICALAFHKGCTDFVAEWINTQLPTAPIQPELWTMYFDGSLMKT
jgi:hypothetical protein